MKTLIQRALSGMFAGERGEASTTLRGAAPKVVDPANDEQEAPTTERDPLDTCNYYSEF